MNRNQNSRFANNPVILDRPRSTFVRDQDVKLTANIGELIPFYIDEILPGDGMKVETSKIIRMEPLVAPIMDNIYLDVYYFFVPNRLVWTHWKEFMGENNDSAWIPQQEYSIPQITSPASTGWTCGSIADYLGIPIGKPNLSVSALPFRAYALTCEQWFRSEVLTDPLNIPTGDSTQTGTNGGSYINDVANGGAPFLASRYFDYFSGALPSPQKSDDVTIKLAEQNVVGNGNSLALTDGTNLFGLGSGQGGSLAGYGGSYHADVGTSVTHGSDYSTSANLGVPTEEQLGSNLDYSGLITAGPAAIMTINELRTAFQIQKYFERAGRAGSRYIEYIKAAFGITSPDARLQRVEYLGGCRIPININQIFQTSETTETSPLGDVAAYSLTSDHHYDFEHSFTEHGYLIGICVARYDHSYQQGIERMWSRKTKWDFYDPIFANLGEQEIRMKEIFAQGSDVVDSDTGIAYDEEVFGYQERWAEYRYKPNRISGMFRSTYSAPLDMWHLADNYSSMPTLSDGWLREDKANLDRALAVTSSVSHQLMMNFYVKNISTRCMPIYSIPGLIDHH